MPTIQDDREETLARAVRGPNQAEAAEPPSRVRLVELASRELQIGCFSFRLTKLPHAVELSENGGGRTINLSRGEEVEALATELRALVMWLER